VAVTFSFFPQVEDNKKTGKNAAAGGASRTPPAVGRASRSSCHRVFRPGAVFAQPGVDRTVECQPILIAVRPQPLRTRHGAAERTRYAACYLARESASGPGAAHGLQHDPTGAPGHAPCVRPRHLLKAFQGYPQPTTRSWTCSHVRFGYTFRGLSAPPQRRACSRWGVVLLSNWSLTRPPGCRCSRVYHLINPDAAGSSAATRADAPLSGKGDSHQIWAR
jgi:hypothetical protein